MRSSHWGAECQAAFDKLKTLLTTSPITAFPDFSQAFRLYTDASTAGLGAILAQVRDGKERIICCASRALNQAEKAYPATKLECLAIVWAVAKFRPYLMAMPFKVYLEWHSHFGGWATRCRRHGVSDPIHSTLVKGSDDK